MFEKDPLQDATGCSGFAFPLTRETMEEAAMTKQWMPACLDQGQDPLCYTLL
jgi:hypothetical protein